MQNNIFNINRLGYLLRRQLLLNSSSMYISLSAIAGVVFIIFFLMGIGNLSCDYEDMAGLFFTVFFLGGYVISSKVFFEISEFRTGYQYLALPASNLEKLLAGWIYSSIIYSIVGIISFYVLSTIACGLASLIMGYHFTPFNFDSGLALKLCAIYMITQTIFVLGGATFKNHPFLMTLLAVFILSFAIGIISFIAGWGIIGEFKSYNFDFNESNMSPHFSYIMEEYVAKGFEIIFWTILGPLFLVTSYFKLKESEV